MAKPRILDLHAAGQRNFYALPFERQLEYLCNKFEVKPIGYLETTRAKIYIAEDWLAKRPEDGEPGWTVLWALRRRGPCVAQAMYMATGCTRNQRVRAALAGAGSFLRDEYAEGFERRRRRSIEQAEKLKELNAPGLFAGLHGTG